MVTNYMGTIWAGSATLTTSVAGAEIITGNARMINLKFISDQSCIVKINGATTGIYIRAQQELLIPVCNSLIITTAGITFNWIAQLG